MSKQQTIAREAIKQARGRIWTSNKELCTDESDVVAAYAFMAGAEQLAAIAETLIEIKVVLQEIRKPLHVIQAADVVTGTVIGAKIGQIG